MHKFDQVEAFDTEYDRTKKKFNVGGWGEELWVEVYDPDNNFDGPFHHVYLNKEDRMKVINRILESLGRPERLELKQVPVTTYTEELVFINE